MRKRTIALLLVLGMVAAACGSDDGGGSDADASCDDLPLASDRTGEAQGDSEAFLSLAARRQLPLRELEDAYIDEVLQFTGGNKVRAAKILGIDRKTLYRRAERIAREQPGAAHGG